MIRTKQGKAVIITAKTNESAWVWVQSVRDPFWSVVYPIDLLVADDGLFEIARALERIKISRNIDETARSQE